MSNGLISFKTVELRIVAVLNFITSGFLLAWFHCIATYLCFLTFQETLDEATDNWGVKVTGVEV